MIPDIFIFGFWQFASAGMLAWGAAALLPIVIHLWSRRKYRQQPWAAMAFLLAAVRASARRMQLEQWILLAVRTAVLILFALALADPRSSLLSAFAGARSGGQTHVVLVLDGSYSMDYRSDDKSRFEAAKELARQLVTAGPQGDGYSLVLMSDPPRIVIGKPAFDKIDVGGEIDALELPHGGASFPATLAQVESVLRQSIERPSREGNLSERRVCIISDLQARTWSEVNSAECRARLGRLENMASLELVDLAQPGENNLAIAQLHIDGAASGLAVVGSELTIAAEVQSFARDDRPRQAVEILVDGQRIADERVDVPAGGRTAVTAVHRFLTAGDHVVEARFADDALPLDNRRWLVVPVRETIRVLAVGGRPGETKHFALALAPRKEDARSLEVVEAPESRLLESDLTQFDCVALCNIGRFTLDQAAALGRYVAGGGGLVVFLGDQVQADNYNELLGEGSKPRVLPARLEDLAKTDRNGYALDPLDYNHSIVAPFRGFPQAGLFTTPVWKYLRVAPLEGAKVALAFSSGDPAIVESQVGRGRCILVATAASPDSLDRATDPPTPWTALPTWPSFPPLAHEMLRLALSGRGDGRNLLVGEELVATLPGAGAEEFVQLRGPGELTERVPLRNQAGESQWSFGPVVTSGVYEAGSDSTVQRFSVNLDPAEGDLARFDPELLPAQLRREKVDAAADAGPLAGGETASYFRWLLAAVLGLLAVESCLAWLFGRSRG
jgi:hypothetical protein